MSKKLSWKKVVLKFAKNGVYVILAGLAATYGQNPMFLAVAPLLAAIENAAKHW